MHAMQRWKDGAIMVEIGNPEYRNVPHFKTKHSHKLAIAQNQSKELILELINAAATLDSPATG